MTKSPSIQCPACGAPNTPEAGKARMACAYCGTNLTIPKHLRTKPKPARKPEKARPAEQISAPDIMRKAQPIAIKAWNFYVVWTWFLRLLPACLVVFIVGVFICLALGALPFVLNLLR